jgi:anti-anti-sigma factor
MDEKLNITRDIQPDNILLNIEGRIDGYWSKHLDEYLEKELREGNYSLALNLTGIHYLSSLGIRTLVKYTKLFHQVNGNFGITEASQSVNDILTMAGMKAILAFKVPHPRPLSLEERGEGEARPDAAEPEDLPSPPRRGAGGEVRPEGAGGEVHEAGFTFSTQKQPNKNPITCRYFGDPAKITGAGYSKADNRTIEFGKGIFGLGLGAIGLGFDDCSTRFGELAGLGDAVVYSPAGKAQSPDYMLHSGALIPKAEMLYGITFNSDFGQLIRFNPSEPNNTINFTKLIESIAAITGFDQMAVVVLAQSNGLVGFSLNQSPVANSEQQASLFEYPEVKNNINFTTTPEYKDMMTICTGIAVKSPSEEIGVFTRPLSPENPIHQHFHASVFSYHPLKKTDINLDETIQMFFDNDTVKTVLHLVNDSRCLTGVGESEFKSGFCWVGEIETFTKMQ